MKKRIIQIRAVIFDLDGTLLDTIEDITDSMNAVLAKLALPLYSAEDYKKFVGEGVEKLAELALPKIKNGNNILNQLALGMREEYSKRWAAKTRPYDGIVKLLEELTRLKIKMAVLSNKSDELTNLSVEKYFGNFKFEFVQGAMDGVPGKPDPRVAIKIANDMKLDPSEFIFLGDSWIDMKTALAAGMYPVGALWGFRDREELESSGARTVIGEPAELLEFFR